MAFDCTDQGNGCCTPAPAWGGVHQDQGQGKRGHHPTQEDAMGRTPTPGPGANEPQDALAAGGASCCHCHKSAMPHSGVISNLLMASQCNHLSFFFFVLLNQYCFTKQPATASTASCTPAPLAMAPWVWHSQPPPRNAFHYLCRNINSPAIKVTSNQPPLLCRLVSHAVIQTPHPHSAPSADLLLPGAEHTLTKRGPILTPGSPLAQTHPAHTHGSWVR